MKKILLISTGGTISAIETTSGLKPSISGSEILSMLSLPDIYTIEFQEILALDSCNIEPSHWKKIAEVIYANLNLFDGIVITHGTDTMCYTASMLSFILQNPPKPIILTGSQKPIHFPETDAKSNLKNALLMAASNYPGIYIVFNNRILLGTCATKIATDQPDAFLSPNSPDIGSVNNDKIIINHHLIQKTDFIFDNNFDPNVFLLKLIPSMKQTIFDMLLQERYKGVIIEGFGAGGIPNYLLSGIKKLIDHNIPTAITSQCWQHYVDLSTYEVGIKPFQMGAIPCKNMTTEAAVTKMMWILAHYQTHHEISQAMLSNIAFEIDEC